MAQEGVGFNGRKAARTSIAQRDVKKDLGMSRRKFESDPTAKQYSGEKKAPKKFGRVTPQTGVKQPKPNRAEALQLWLRNNKKK